MVVFLTNDERPPAAIPPNSSLLSWLSLISAFVSSGNDETLVPLEDVLSLLSDSSWIDLWKVEDEISELEVAAKFWL